MESEITSGKNTLDLAAWIYQRQFVKGQGLLLHSGGLEMKT